MVYLRKIFSPNRKSCKGYTLVEILVATGILVVVTFIMSVSLLQGNRLQRSADIHSELQLTGMRVMDLMVAELRTATRLATVSPPNIYIYPEGKVIAFYLPVQGVVDSSGNTAWDTGSPVEYQFVPDKNQLCRIQGGNSRILANNVSAVSFDDISTDTSLHINEVKIQLSLEKVVYQGTNASASFVAAVKLRN